MLKQDDYDVIVYQMLRYLYAQFKRGRKLIEMAEICSNLKTKKIERSYFDNIVETAYNEGLITGPLEEHYFIDEEEPVYELTSAKITPDGIHYLESSPAMKSVEKFLGVAAKIRTLIP